VTRQVTKFGPSKASAERAVKLALRDRTAPGQSEITAETRVAMLGKRWLEDLPADAARIRGKRTRENGGPESPLLTFGVLAEMTVIARRHNRREDSHVDSYTNRRDATFQWDPVVSLCAQDDSADTAPYRLFGSQA
jgi:hypothetical protein